MEEREAAFAAALAFYQDTAGPGDQQALIALLREVQRLYGCVPVDIQQRVAQAVGTKPALVAALVKRVPGLTEAGYRHQVTVCTGPRCSAKGGAKVLRAFTEALGVSPGAVTPDGRFRLDTRNCLKKCGAAPNVVIDGVHHPAVRPEDVPNLLKQYP